MQQVLRAVLERLDVLLDRAFPPSWNPLYHLGGLGFFFYWIVALSGVYLFIFFDTGITAAFASVERLTHDQWYAGGVMRSLHRYASDGMVVVMVLHLVREFSLDRHRGARWFTWVTGVPILWLVFLSGITGYWLVWDMHAQYVAVVSTEWLDRLPIFGLFDRAELPVVGDPRRPVLHPDDLPAHRATADSAAGAPDPPATGQEARDQPRARARRRHVPDHARPVPGQARDQPRPGQSRGGAGRPRPRLVLSRPLPSVRELARARDLGRGPGADPDPGRPAVAAAVPRGARSGGRSRQLQRLHAVRPGLPVRGDPDDAPERRPAVRGRGGSRSGALRPLRDLRRRVPHLDAVPARVRADPGDRPPGADHGDASRAGRCGRCRAPRRAPRRGAPGDAVRLPSRNRRHDLQE